ncbi:MAG: HD domain-containing protein, partial [Candidatus Hydrogenedentes bacterium]|nr:HD domain-containing protein [Candidatus Hydrogenedentota bacterium]
MRIVSVGNLTPGQVVGRPIVDAGGKVLLNRDVVLTPEYIRALQAKEFSTIYVKGGENEPDVALDEDIDPAIRARAIKALGDTFKTIEHQLQGLRKQSFDDLTKVCASTSMRALFGKGGPIAEVFSTVNGILDEVLTRSTLAGLTSIKSADSQAYNHSIDVCVVGIMIGRAVGMTDARLKQLAVGCLLHDIGKVFVDRAANEVTQVRQHTLLGYELLKNADDPEIMAPHVALEHHERQDGNGEPRGLVGSNTIERDRALPPPIPTLI